MTDAKSNKFAESIGMKRTGKKEPTNINLLTDEYLRLCYHGSEQKKNI